MRTSPKSIARMSLNNNNTINNNNDVNTMMNIPKDLSFVNSPNGIYDPLLPSNEYGVNSEFVGIGPLLITSLIVALFFEL